MSNNNKNWAKTFHVVSTKYEKETSTIAKAPFET